MLLRTEGEVLCNFGKLSLLKRLTIANCVINENLVSFSSHCDDSCHESTASQSAADEICNMEGVFCFCIHFSCILTLSLLLVLDKSLWLLKN